MVDVAMLFGANIHKAKTDSMEVFNLLLKLAQVFNIKTALQHLTA